MANKKRISREMSNLATITMYRDILTFIAQNSIEIKNLPPQIDAAKVNFWLITRGAVAWFWEDVTETFEILPFKVTNRVDIYGNPTQIEVFADNGYHKKLARGEFVIIYDNTLKKSIFPTIMQFAERMALSRRVEDINIFNQKTPRIFQCTTEQELSLKTIIESLDTFNTHVLTSDNIDFDKIVTDFNPVPFVADKISDNTSRIFGEYLQFIGITSVSVEKKERLISSEIMYSQGGALVSRLGRLNARNEACDKINRLYNQNLEVQFYEQNEEIEEVINNVVSEPDTVAADETDESSGD